MSLLDNIKSNFLGNRNSFNVTFNNKSPLSYVGAESIPAHGSSIKTQMEAPKVSDVYAAHSPKDYLEAETEKYHAMGDAVVSIVESLYGAAGGGGGGEGMMGGGEGGGGMFSDIMGGEGGGMMDSFGGGEGGGMMDSLDTFGGGGKGKDEGPSTEEMKEKWCKDYPDSDVC